VKTHTVQWRLVGMAVLGSIWCLALGSTSVQAQEVTAKTVVDRAEIQDLITRYYYNFGREKAESFSDFYADDAELILGTKHFKGKEGIAKAYERTGDNPVAKAYSFTVTFSNPLIVVHGNTATSKVIFTEFLIQNKGDALKVRTQGREYATFVKAKGQWRYKTRQIADGAEPPDGWKE